MTENWKPYLCNVNDKLASIFVNLGLRGEVPIASKPWLLCGALRHAELIPSDFVNHPAV